MIEWQYTAGWAEWKTGRVSREWVYYFNRFSCFRKLRTSRNLLYVIERVIKRYKFSIIEKKSLL